MSDRSLITQSIAYELGKFERPTIPSLVIPGTEEALRRGCICPVEENLKRLQTGARPLLRRNCRVHNKVCQADPCGCYGVEQSHLQLHERCEHCTNILHVCVVCEAVYLDDGDDPSLAGWMFIDNLGDSKLVIRGWRCRTCV